MHPPSRRTPVIVALLVTVVLPLVAFIGGPAAATVASPRQLPLSVATSFRPSRNGFAFRNPRPDTRTPAVQRALSGRCGGMTYGALDYYREGVEASSSGAPDEYLVERSADSIVQNGLRFMAWTVMPDLAGASLMDGVGSLTREQELPALAKGLESGPVPLGLVRARSLSRIGLNHQVVAYAMRRVGDSAFVSVYDSCQPGADDVVLVVDLSRQDTPIAEYAGKWKVASWRGFFVESYSPGEPPLK